MTQFLRILCGLLFAALMTACGGGGGSPGAVPGGQAPASATVVVDIVDASGNPLTSVSSNPTAFARATVRDSAGSPVSGAVVTFGGTALLSYIPASGTALTGSDGVATIQLQPATGAAGAGTLTADADVAGKAAKQGTVAVQVARTAPSVQLDIVTSAGTVTTTVGNLTVYARAKVLDAAGAAAPNVVVTFTSSNLVAFSPATGSALTDASGQAMVQIMRASATAGGAGVLQADATVGTTPATRGSYAYQVPQGVPDTPTARVADFALLLDRTTLTNGGTSTAKLTVVTVDSSNNVVAGASVSVSTDAHSIFTPASSVTDAQGQYTGQIGIGTDKSDRQITATVTVNGITKTTAMKVIGSKITIQSVPATPSPGQATAATVTLVDSAGNPIAGVPIKFGGTVPTLTNTTVTTDLSGVATQAFIAPGTAGVYTINATGNGVSSADYQLQVFSSVVPVATIPAGAMPSLAASPNVLAVNAPGSTSNKSTLRFLFLDGSNQPIKNVRVRFQDITTGLAAVGASISSGTTTLYTDASGTVTAQYIAGQNSSPTNGVTVKACYSASNFAVGTCPASVTTSLTVAGQALAVSIGDDNLLGKGPGTYIKRFAVTVADSAGRAVAGAPVDISVDLTHYAKGAYDFPWVPSDLDWGLSLVPLSLTGAYPSIGAVPSLETGRSWCPNEDTNRNANVDPLENINGSVDSNGQPTLEPRKSDLIVSYDDPSVTTTNASGILVIKVEYSQRFATWLAYKVRVTANVAGSQGMAERLFVTQFVEGDQVNGSFLSPPYGFSACNSRN